MELDEQARKPVDVKKLRRNAKGVLEKVLRYLASGRLRENVAMILEVQLPLSVEHSNLIHMMKNKDGFVPTCFSHWSNQGYWLILKKLIMICKDPTRPARVGMNVDIGPSFLSTEDPLVLTNNAMVAGIFLLTAHHLKHRASEGVQHSGPYPQRLAGLVHESADVREPFKKRLRRHCRLFEKVQNEEVLRTQPTLKDWMSRHFFNTALGRLTRLIALRGDEGLRGVHSLDRRLI